MIFLAHGTNYNFWTATKHLLTIGSRSDGPRLKQYLKEYYGGSQVELYSKGRGALSSAISAVAQGKNLGVAVNAMTCSVVVDAILYAGCTPVYVDLAKKSVNFGIDELMKVTNSSDTAIGIVVVQNTLGVPADIQSIEDFARKEKMVIIEDLAHAVGGKYADGRMMGKVGSFVVLSFARDKILDAISGGALIVRDENFEINEPTAPVRLVDQVRDRLYPILAWFARLFYNLGFGRYFLALIYRLKLVVRLASVPVDPNQGMPMWQARLALGRLENLGAEVDARLDNTSQLRQKLSDLEILKSSNGIRLAFFVKHRDEIIKRAENKGLLLNDTWYDVPVAPERIYRKMQFEEEKYPNAMWVTQHIVNLPTRSDLKLSDLDKMARILEEKD